MSNKEMVIGALSQLPDDASMQEIVRQVEFFTGLEEAREQARRGEGVSIEEARRLIRERVREVARESLVEGSGLRVGS